MTKPLLIKLGGAVLENEQALANLFSALTAYLGTIQGMTFCQLKFPWLPTHVRLYMLYPDASS